MQSWAQDSYLTTEVMTATPQKLQLMLIEAAIRFAERARQQWKEDQNEEACESLIRAQDIVSHILGGLKSGADPQLARKVASVYLFIFRSLMEANFHHDEKKLDGALKVLQTERETWRLVCENLADSGAHESAARQFVPSRQGNAPNLSPLDLPADAGDIRSGFSLEA